METKSDQSNIEIDALLRPLPADQQALIRIVGEATLDIGSWPVYQYVEAKLDEEGYNAYAVFGGLPYMTDGSLTYSLVRRDRTGSESEPVKLTVAGMAHLPSFTSTVSMFLRVVQMLGVRRSTAAYDPSRVITVEVPGHVIIENLALADEPLVDLLPKSFKASRPHGTVHTARTRTAGSCSPAPPSDGSALSLMCTTTSNDSASG